MVSLTAHDIDNNAPGFWLEQTAEWVGRVAGVASAFCLLLICLFTGYDVFMRYALNAPTIWANEISTYLMVAAAMLGASYAFREGAHIRVELVTDRLSPERREFLERVAAWAGLWFVLVASWQGVRLVHDSYIYGSTTFTMLLTPLWMPQVAVAVGWILMVPPMLAEIRTLSRPLGPGRDWILAALPLAIAVILLGLGELPLDVPPFGIDLRLVLIIAGILGACFYYSGAMTMIGLLIIQGGAAIFLGGIEATGAGPGWIISALGIAIVSLMLLGLRVFLAVGLVGLVGLHVMVGTPLPEATAERSWEVLNSFTLTALPMFVLMGVFLLRSGVSGDVFEAMVKWIGRWPGGLAHSGIAACMVFSTVSGSSLATAATMGKVACPEMLDRHYSRSLTFGSIAAGGTLGILIPPSIALIIYGSTVGAPIPQLFMAGIIPGIILTLAFMAVILVWGLLRPAAAPAGDRYSWSERIASLSSVFPLMFLILAVLGSLYLGVATPTEAGAVGALAAFGLCVYRRKIDLLGVLDGLRDAAKTTSFLMVIIVGASVMTFVFDYLRLPQSLAEAVVEAAVSGPVVILAIALIYIILGMFVETVAMILMTLPVMFPIVIAYGYDPVWFGIFVVILVEVGLITPPVGVNLFILRGVVPSAQLSEIAWGVVPFGIAMLAVLTLLFFVPEIALWLPSQLR